MEEIEGWSYQNGGSWIRDDGEVIIIPSRASGDEEFVVYLTRDPEKALDDTKPLFDEDVHKVWEHDTLQDAIDHGNSLQSGAEPKYGWNDERATLDDYDRWYGEGRVYGESTDPRDLPQGDPNDIMSNANWDVLTRDTRAEKLPEDIALEIIGSVGEDELRSMPSWEIEDFAWNWLVDRVGMSNEEPKFYNFLDDVTSEISYALSINERKTMKLDKKLLREMILSEAKKLNRKSDPVSIANEILAAYGTMFLSEGIINSRVDEHVKQELVEMGYTFESTADFDLLDEVMEELTKMGLVEAGMGSSAQFLRGRGVRTREDLYGDETPPEPPDERIIKQVIARRIRQLTGGDRREALALVQDRGRRAELVNLSRQLKRDYAQFEQDRIERLVLDELIAQAGVKSEGLTFKSKTLTTESLREMILKEMSTLAGHSKK